MDEDVDGASGMASPMSISHTSNWAATSTYDVYMVDTPKEDGEEEKDPPQAPTYSGAIQGESAGSLPEGGVNGRFLKIRQTLMNLTKIRVKK